jgi:large subunit ribosomal protein L28
VRWLGEAALVPENAIKLFTCAFHSKAPPSVAKRTRSGLFAGRRILSGNNVSEDGGNRTRRVWKPNAQNATLYSELLDRKIRFKVTPAALRNIDKAGGLDAYLLHSKEALHSEQGAKVREELLLLSRQAGPK